MDVIVEFAEGFIGLFKAGAEDVYKRQLPQERVPMSCMEQRPFTDPAVR